MDLPPELKCVKPFLQHAQQVGNFDPVIAYHCRHYAAQLGSEQYRQNPTPDIKMALLSLLERLEKDKKALGDQLDAPENHAPRVREYALKIFEKAVAEDCQGNADQNTARSFYATTILINVLKLFLKENESLDDEILEKQQYAKFKAADINTALKMGKKPTKGLPKKPEELEQEANLPSPPREISERVGPKGEPPSSSFETDPPEPPAAPEKPANDDRNYVPLAYTQSAYDTMGVPADNIDAAHKFSRHACSALQFDDYTNAISCLCKALNALGVQTPQV